MKSLTFLESNFALQFEYKRSKILSCKINEDGLYITDHDEEKHA